MESIAHGVMNSADIVADVVIEMPHICGWHCDELGEAAIAIDANDLRVRADVRIARSAEKTAPVDNMSLGSYAISFFDVGDETPDLHDISGEFMTDDKRRLASRLRPVIPVVDVNISAAHAGPSDTDENFIISDSWLGDIAEDKSGAGIFFY
jgi:hypothetical protein